MGRKKERIIQLQRLLDETRGELDAALSAVIEVTKGLSGLGCELAAPPGVNLAEVPVLARAHIIALNGEATTLRAKVEELEGRIRSHERTTADALKVQAHRDETFGRWIPRKGDVAQYEGRKTYIMSVDEEPRPYRLGEYSMVGGSIIYSRAVASELTLIRSANVDDPVEGVEVPAYVLEKKAPNWTPNLGDKVRLDTVVHYRGLSAMFDGVVVISIGPNDHQTMAVRMEDLRPVDERAAPKAFEADAHDVAIGDQVSLDSLDEGRVVAFVKVDGMTYAQVQWRKGERLIHDIPLVKEWRDLYLERAQEKAAESAPIGQQHQDVPSIGAFDALGKENTRLRRKLERVFEALKDTPTEAP